jgi:calcineurin-like phosphoesterase family protein
MEMVTKMSEVFFISDTHFGHNAVLKFDNRPFRTTEENDNTIIDNWNNRVGIEDDVYFLGDFSWYNSTKSTEIAKSLNGNKHFIIGNHDSKILRNNDFRKQFIEITDYKEIKYSDEYSIILCHYPIVAFKNHYYGWFHLYGHVHNTWEYYAIRECQNKMIQENKVKCRMYNVGCMMPYMNYTPRTLEEIIESSGDCCPVQDLQ